MSEPYVFALHLAFVETVVAWMGKSNVREQSESESKRLAHKACRIDPQNGNSSGI